MPSLGVAVNGAARHGFEKLHDFVGAKNNRQLARLPRIGDALGNNLFLSEIKFDHTDGAIRRELVSGECAPTA